MQSLRVVKIDDILFVNVDLFSHDGITRAAELSLVTSHVADLAYTSYLQDSTQLFTPQQGVFGRLLIVFRDPVERALNRFEQVKSLEGNSELRLNSYASDPKYQENNPLVRSLVGLGPNESLGQEHLVGARNAIDNYILVGLFEEIPETIKRYEEFFAWYVGGTIPEVYSCHERIASDFEPGYTVKDQYGAEDATGFNKIVASHRMDILVYRHAQEAFKKQGGFLAEEEEEKIEKIAADHKAHVKAEDEKQGLTILAEANANAV